MIGEYLKRKILTRKWRKRNKHNETAPNNIFDINKVSVGNIHMDDWKFLCSIMKIA